MYQGYDFRISSARGNAMYQVYENAPTPTVLILTLVNIFLLSLIVFAVCRWASRKREAAPVRQQESAAGSVSELLRQARTSSGMSQEFVAEQLGVSRQAVSKWENGTAMPSTANLLALAKLLHIPVEMLIRNASEKR